MLKHRIIDWILVGLFVTAVFCLVGCQGACDEDEFECTRGVCVPDAWKCDGEPDCENGKDEKNCPVLRCEENEHKCLDNGFAHCIPIAYRCDDDPDCGDGSDEDPAICLRPRPRI